MRIKELIAQLQATAQKYPDVVVCFDSDMATLDPATGKNYNLPALSEITTVSCEDSGPGTDHVCYLW